MALYSANTVNKFGIPTTLGTKSPNSALLQPKYKYRFRVYVIGFGQAYSAYNALNLTGQVQSVGKPSVTFAEVKVSSYNSTAYLAGKHSWEAITLTVKDDVTNAVSTLIGQQLQKQLNMYDQSATADGANYKFKMAVDVLDGTNSGTPLESWWLEGCYLANIKYGDLDYTDDSTIQLIEMSVRFDNATQTGNNGDESIMPRLPDGPGVLPGVNNLVA